MRSRLAQKSTAARSRRTIAQGGLGLLEFLQQEISRTDRLIAELAQGDEPVQFLASVPGIGVFLSVLIRWEVDIIERFRQAKKFASYTGLVPSTYASGNRIVHGRLTKQG